MTDASDSGPTPVARWWPSVQGWRTFWKQMLSAFPEAAPVTAAPAAALSGPLSVQLETPVPIRVSGQGRRFNFHIHAHCVWSSTSLNGGELLSYAYRYTPHVIRRLTQVSARHAAHFGPHRMAELEAELQQVLSGTAPWSYPPDRALVECQPHVWVEVDDHVWRLARPYWEKVMTLACEHDVADFAARLKRQRGPAAGNRDNGTSARGTARPARDPADEVRQVVADLRAAANRLEDLLRGTQPGADGT